MLAHVRAARTLDLALNLARGYSLAVVETDSLPLSEWGSSRRRDEPARWSTSADTLNVDVVQSLDQASIFGGRDGWTGSHEKPHTRSVLNDLVIHTQAAPAALTTPTQRAPSGL